MFSGKLHQFQGISRRNLCIEHPLKTWFFVFFFPFWKMHLKCMVLSLPFGALRSKPAFLWVRRKVLTAGLVQTALACGRPQSETCVVPVHRMYLHCLSPPRLFICLVCWSTCALLYLFFHIYMYVHMRFSSAVMILNHFIWQANVKKVCLYTPGLVKLKPKTAFKSLSPVCSTYKQSNRSGLDK